MTLSNEENSRDGEPDSPATLGCLQVFLILTSLGTALVALLCIGKPDSMGLLQTVGISSATVSVVTGASVITGLVSKKSGSSVEKQRSEGRRKIAAAVGVTFVLAVVTLVAMFFSVFIDPSGWLLATIPTVASILAFSIWFGLLFRLKSLNEEVLNRNRKLGFNFILYGSIAFAAGEVAHLMIQRIRVADDPLANRLLPLALCLLGVGGSVAVAGLIMRQRANDARRSIDD